MNVLDFLRLLKDSLVTFLVSLFKRKLLFGVLFYVLSLFLVSQGHMILCLCIIVTCILCILISVKKIKIGFLTDSFIFALVFFVIGFLVMNLAESEVTSISDGDNIRLSGVITNREEMEFSDRYTIKSGFACSLCYLYAKKGLYYKIGDRVEATGTVEKFDIPRNDGEFNTEAYYKTINIRFAIQSEEVKLIERSRISLKESLRCLRDSLAEKIDVHMKNNNGLLKAIVLGDKSDVDANDKELYQRAGISHILAISGLHVGIFSTLIFAVFNSLLFPKKISGIISVTVLIIYAVFSGFSPSVVRAVSMFIVSNAAVNKGKNYDIPTALAVSFFIYTLIFPYAYNYAGTLLSYLAVFSIWIFSMYYKKIRRLKYADKVRDFLDRKVKKTIYMSLFLSFFSLPVVIYYFYSLPVFSIAINLYVIPMMSVLFILAVSGIVFSFISGTIASFIFSLCSYIIQSFTKLSDIAVNRLNGAIVIGKPSVLEITLYYLFLFIILLLLIKVKRKYFLMMLLIIPVVFLLLKSDCDSITMIDVDQGDCTVITTKSGEVFMVDCGSLGKNEVFKYTVEPYLLSNGIKTIDYCFLSHADMDHINGIIEYLNKPVSLIEIRNIIMTKQMLEDEEVIENIIKKAGAKGINVKTMNAGDRIVYEDIEFCCIHPSADFVSSDVNDSSMVLEVNLNCTKSLFTGDISSDIENELKVNDVTLLKVSHHGSDTATGEKLLESISPEIGIISCGTDNSYGHPAARVIEDLERYKVKIYVSALRGQTRMIINKESIRVKTYFD